MSFSFQKLRYSGYLIVILFPWEKDGYVSFNSYCGVSEFLKTKAAKGTRSVKPRIQELRLSVLFSLAYVRFH